MKTETQQICDSLIGIFISICGDKNLAIKLALISIKQTIEILQDELDYIIPYNETDTKERFIRLIATEKRKLLYIESL